MKKLYGDLEKNTKFGDWTVLNVTGRKNHNRYYLCQCKCGTLKSIIIYNLVKGKTTMCRQCSEKMIGKKNFKHGRSASFKGKTISGLGTEKSFEEWASYLNVTEVKLRKLLRKQLTIDSILHILQSKSPSCALSPAK